MFFGKRLHVAVIQGEPLMQKAMDVLLKFHEAQGGYLSIKSKSCALKLSSFSRPSVPINSECWPVRPLPFNEGIPAGIRRVDLSRSGAIRASHKLTFIAPQGCRNPHTFRPQAWRRTIARAIHHRL